MHATTKRNSFGRKEDPYLTNMSMHEKVFYSTFKRTNGKTWYHIYTMQSTTFETAMAKVDFFPSSFQCFVHALQQSAEVTI